MRRCPTGPSLHEYLLGLPAEDQVIFDKHDGAGQSGEDVRGNLYAALHFTWVGRAFLRRCAPD